MTQQEILEYSKTCVEFLGWEKTHPKIKDWHIYITPIGSISYDKMLFHSDWNWIMEVVEAIEKLADWTLECLNYSDGSRDYQMMIPLSHTNIINKDKKEAVVQAINQFLIWYNNGQK